MTRKYIFKGYYNLTIANVTYVFFFSITIELMWFVSTFFTVFFSSLYFSRVNLYDGNESLFTWWHYRVTILCYVINDTKLLSDCYYSHWAVIFLSFSFSFPLLILALHFTHSRSHSCSPSLSSNLFYLYQSLSLSIANVHWRQHHPLFNRHQWKNHQFSNVTFRTYVS